jgi:hypothetical protein
MTNNDMGPAFGLLLAGLLAFFLSSFLAVPDSGILWSRALRLIGDSFPAEERIRLPGSDPAESAEGYFSGADYGISGWDSGR